MYYYYYYYYTPRLPWGCVIMGMGSDMCQLKWMWFFKKRMKI